MDTELCYLQGPFFLYCYNEEIGSKALGQKGTGFSAHEINHSVHKGVGRLSEVPSHGHHWHSLRGCPPLEQPLPPPSSSPPSNHG